MGKKTPEDNSVEAAEKQGVWGLRQANNEARANRPDQYTPFGSITWDRPDYHFGSGYQEGDWVQRVNLNPEYQAILDRQTGMIGREQSLQDQLMQNIQNQGAVDLGQFGQMDMSQYGMLNPQSMRQEAQDAAYQYETNRLDPQFEQQGRDLEVKLRGQGLRPGDAAYDSQMASFNTARNDAYEQARLGSYAVGRDEADLAFNQAMANRQGGFERDITARQQAIDNYLRGREATVLEGQSANSMDTLSKAMNAFGVSGGGTEG